MPERYSGHLNRAIPRPRSTPCYAAVHSKVGKVCADALFQHRNQLGVHKPKVVGDVEDMHVDGPSRPSDQLEQSTLVSPLHHEDQIGQREVSGGEPSRRTLAETSRADF